MTSSLRQHRPRSTPTVCVPKTDDEDETVEITCPYCREEKQWAEHLRARNEAMEAEFLALARGESEMRRRMELETTEATRHFNEANEAYLTEYKLNMALRQQCDRLGVGIFGGHLPNLPTNRQMEGHAAEKQHAGPSAEMDRT